MHASFLFSTPRDTGHTNRRRFCGYYESTFSTCPLWLAWILSVGHFLILIIAANSLKEFVGWRLSLASHLIVFWFLSWHNYHYDNHLLTVQYQSKTSTGKALIPCEATNVHCLCRGSASIWCSSYPEFCMMGTSSTLWDPQLYQSCHF